MDLKWIPNTYLINHEAKENLCLLSNPDMSKRFPVCIRFLPFTDITDRKELIHRHFF